jgi:hypothetical protein
LVTPEVAATAAIDYGTITVNVPVVSGLEGPSLSATDADATFDTSEHCRDAQVL